MDETKPTRLTERQKQCLRLVHAGLRSKEIAPQLGIEPGSVDQHIKLATRLLGVSDRRAAARLLAEAETHTQKQVIQPFGIEPYAHCSSNPASTEKQPRADPGAALREEQSPYLALPPAPARNGLPLPIRGDRPDDLTPSQRIGWIFGILLAIVLIFGVFLAGLEALSRLGRSVG